MKIKKLIFEIPGEPKGKQRPRATLIRRKDDPGPGRVVLYTARPTRIFENHVALAFVSAYPDQPPHEGPVQMKVEAFFIPPRSASKLKRARMLAGLEQPTKKPDGVNIAAAICDGLNGLAYRDDSQVTAIFVLKKYGDMARTKVTLFLSELEKPGRKESANKKTDSP